MQHPLTPYQQRINRARSRTRARGEHPFPVVKRLWGFKKGVYRGLAKHPARAFALFGFANLYLPPRRLLLPPWVPCLI
jgi:IS5 family transposase